MKNILLGVTLFILLIVSGILYIILLPKNVNDQGVSQLEIGNVSLEIEIADTAIEQIQGLSGRASLPLNKGMLFIFPDTAIRSFWMRGMKFPLDIIWIKGDKVIGVSENLPPAFSSNIPVYYSPEPVDKVLEINAGLVNKLGIKIGDKIETSNR